MENLECPLCDLAASFRFVHSPNGKLFSCKECNDFFIDSASESYLIEIPETTRTEVRDRLIDLAKSSRNGRLLVIREPRNDEIHGDGHGVAKLRMLTEWKNRSE
jgi:hypothetical protein